MHYHQKRERYVIQGYCPERKKTAYVCTVDTEQEAIDICEGRMEPPRRGAIQKHPSELEYMSEGACSLLVQGWRNPITDGEIRPKPHLYYA
jgi:hypothetical protein